MARWRTTTRRAPAEEARELFFALRENGASEWVSPLLESVTAVAAVALAGALLWPGPALSNPGTVPLAALLALCLLLGFTRHGLAFSWWPRPLGWDLQDEAASARDHGPVRPALRVRVRERPWLLVAVGPRWMLATGLQVERTDGHLAFTRDGKHIASLRLLETER